MALPIILGVAAAVTAVGGIGAGINGAVKLKDAKDTMEVTKDRHNANLQRFEKTNIATSRAMDTLGKKEMSILASFEDFSSTWEKIHNRPDFKSIRSADVDITQYSPGELKKVSVGAGVLLGGLGSAAVGTAGGFAAAGATTAAVMALGTASTGTAIASLSGVAATNAALAALGGGAIAAGGGGMALGTTILGASTLGIGLLIGGVIFSISGNAISNKADKAYGQMRDAERKIDEICKYLEELKTVATNYFQVLSKVGGQYNRWFDSLYETVNQKTDWNQFTPAEKMNAEDTVLAVGLLYEMCKVKLVLASKDDSGQNTINYKDIQDASDKAAAFLT